MTQGAHANARLLSHTDLVREPVSKQHTSWYHADVRGSTVMLSGANGEATAAYRYDAYGTLYGEHPVAGTPKPTVPEVARPAVERGTEYLYTGKRLDPETEHYDYGFRDYAPRLARFTTVDPIKDGPHWYAYVGNDPINRIDPSGLQGEPTETRAQEFVRVHEETNRFYVEQRDELNRDFNLNPLANLAERTSIEFNYAVETESNLQRLLTGRIPSNEDISDRVEKILEDAQELKPTKRGPQFDKLGGFREAQQDFYKLRPFDVRQQPTRPGETVLTGSLPSGGTATVRSFSGKGGTGPPTLDITDPRKSETERITKVRYRKSK